MSFLDGVSDAFDALASNVLPFYEAKVSADAAKQNAQSQTAIQTAQAQANAASSAAKAKTYAALAAGTIAAVALLIMLKRKRG